MAEQLSTYSIISFVAAGFFLLVAIVLGIYFRIPTVIGDLTGRNAKKSIARMRESNEKASKKAVQTGKKDAVRKKPAEPRAEKKKQEAIVDHEQDNDDMPETGLLGEKHVAILEESTELLEGTEQMPLPDELQETVPRVSKVEIKMLEEIIFIHTTEVIQ